MNEERIKSPEGVSNLAETIAGKYLTFRLGAEEYGFEILKVQEIIGMMHLRPMPRTPDYVRGVINLRGRVIPVIELRRKFELPSREDTDRTCIIVVQATVDQCPVTMGVLVDEVSEVFDIRPSQIEPPPSFGTRVSTDFILGLGKLGERVVVLLDIDRVLSEQEWPALAQAAEA